MGNDATIVTGAVRSPNLWGGSAALQPLRLPYGDYRLHYRRRCYNTDSPSS